MAMTEATGGIGCLGCLTAPPAPGEGGAAAGDEIVLAVPAAACAARLPQP